MNEIRFELNGQPIREALVRPTTTLLNYLRSHLGLTGTKEGCAEGDCGACTVAILDPDAPGGPAYRAVNACLVLLPMVQGKQVFTVEGLASAHGPHVVQESLVEHLGSQCGYCTPGVVMSMFEACYRRDLDEAWKLDDQLCGNLCRCTGYRPIRYAAAEIAGRAPSDRFGEALRHASRGDLALEYEREGFRYFMPTTFERLWAILEAYPSARIVNGGTDLSLEITKQFKEPPLLVSLEGLAALSGIERASGRWRIGAGTRLSDLEAAAREGLTPVERMLRFFGSRQIKHRGTVGGNLCNASPIGDLAPVFLALGASVVLRSARGERSVPLDRFFTGYRKTALETGEILVAVDVPEIPAAARAVAYKVSKRQELDISAVAAGLYVELDPAGRVQVARLAFGGLAATPARALNTEAALLGQPWAPAQVEAAIGALETDFAPIDDHRGSAWYRRTVAQNLLRGFFLETQRQPLPRLCYRPTGTVQPEVER
ncbi:MAG: xanthine dehydrogenase small subunit [Deltaproteobacteria bacterium]|nr:xanthine dehydrogenase small subunit [Deltaproteobacteria bacterium]